MSTFSVDHDELPSHARIHEEVGGDCTRAANDVPEVDAGIASDLVTTLINAMAREVGSAGLVNALIAEQLRELADDARATDEEAAEAFAISGSAIPGLDP
jgi:hypothetical protein